MSRNTTPEPLVPDYRIKQMRMYRMMAETPCEVNYIEGAEDVRKVYEAELSTLRARLRSLTEAAQVAADALEEMLEPDWAQEYRERTCDQALSLLSQNGVVPGGG